MNETEILEMFKKSMMYLKKENAPKLANIVNELDKLTYNDALNLLENVNIPYYNKYKRNIKKNIYQDLHNNYNMYFGKVVQEY